MTGTWTCSEDEDFGSLGDNKVIVTGGTSGTPADFASFVTADRAGEAVLLAATAGLSPTLALTYAVRPVEICALLISFIVASKTAEADFIFITGTDWRGAAQTESLDVTAGNGTYVSTKYFATISNIDCSDNSAGGGTQWADGTVRATQPQWGFIWDYGLGQYRIDSTQIDFGDNSTSGHFTSTREQVAFNTSSVFFVRTNQTLQLGVLYGSYGINGSMWSLDHTTDSFVILSAGTMLVYASLFDCKALTYRLFANGILTIKNSIWQHARYDVGGSWKSRTEFLSSSTLDWEDVYFNNFDVVTLNVSPTADNVQIHRSYAGVNVQSVTANISGMKFSSLQVEDITTWGATAVANLIDLLQGVSVVRHVHDGAEAWEKYTCNIHVTDRDGTDLQSVTVACEDKDMTSVFSVSTDASGDIAEQTISYRKWIDTTETLTTFSPHKFTISKAGYETLILEAITVNSPIVWHLELQTPKAPPRAWRH